MSAPGNWTGSAMECGVDDGVDDDIPDMETIPDIGSFDGTADEADEDIPELCDGALLKKGPRDIHSCGKTARLRTAWYRRPSATCSLARDFWGPSFARAQLALICGLSEGLGRLSLR